MPDPNDTTRFIEQELSLPLERLDAERQSALTEWKRSRRWLRLAAFGFFFLATLILGPFGFVVGGCLAFCGYLAIASSRKKKLFGTDLRDRFKREVIEPLVLHAAPGATYRPDGHVSARDFAGSGMFQVEPSRFTGDDLVQGRHGDVEIRFSELDVGYRDPSMERTGPRTAFKGLFFVADFHKDFEGFTIVRPRRPGLAKSYLGTSRVEKYDAGMALTERMMGPTWRPGAVRHGAVEPVELEDPEFAEHFDVLSTDQVEARYILSPGMMRRLLEFRRSAIRAREELSARLAARRKLIQVIDQSEMENGMFFVSFARSNVYVAKHHFRDLFEIDPKKPLTDRAQIETYAADLRFALGIVDDLALNVRIWSRAPASP
jgi:hypothetical protein